MTSPDAANEPMREHVLAALISIDARLARIEAALVCPANEPMRGERRLLSMREAASMLGVSRTRTLPLLVKDRRIRVVTVNGRPKVPREEVERIEREGTGSFRPSATRPIPDRSRAPLARDLV